MAKLTEFKNALVPEKAVFHKVGFSISALITNVTGGFFPAGTPLKSINAIVAGEEGYPLSIMANPKALVAGTTDVVGGLLAHDVTLEAGVEASVGVVVEGVYYSGADVFSALTAAQIQKMAHYGLTPYGVVVPTK